MAPRWTITGATPINNGARQGEKPEQRQQLNELATEDLKEDRRLCHASGKPGVSCARDASSESQSIRHFFRGRFVLITGATGFLGKVLIEKLLYSCPSIGGIYVLVRRKRDKTASERLEEFASSPLFERVRRRDPHFTRTMLRAIEGDVVAPNLGVSAEEEEMLREKVSVVIHSAATIRFDEKIKDAVELNINGALKLYSLSKRLPHLVALIHVSTAYANCDRECVLEAVYPPPPNYDSWLDVLQWLDENDSDKITKNIIGERPNTYTYTKCLAEHFLMEEYRRYPLPFAIGQLNPMTWGEMCDHCLSALEKCPLEGSVRTPKFRISKSGFTRTVAFYLKQLLPAYIGDFLLRAFGREPYFVRLQGRVHKAVDVLEYFTCRSWQFHSSNVTSLLQALTAEDQEEFNFDIARLDWKRYMHLYVKGTKVFCLKENTENLERARKHHFRLRVFGIMIKMITILAFVHVWRRYLSQTALAKKIVTIIPSVASVYCLMLC